ncbi:hypothetical protein [Cohnella sp. GbtcB17]|uniref:hypothetical protein n=1 Tax=Cohnella sp. GbtcB17 TaxID=2824762 RepID=UPI001C30E85D|nr:hypothetical protein [Cohnella sp. GbtcB17]
MSQNSGLILVYSAALPSIKNWILESKLQAYVFPANGEWNAIALKNGLTISSKRAQSLSQSLDAIATDIKYYEDYQLELCVFKSGKRIAQYIWQLDEDRSNHTKKMHLDVLKSFASYPEAIDQIEPTMDHTKALKFLKQAFDWCNSLEFLEYNFFVHADKKTLLGYKAELVSNKQPIIVSNIIRNICESALKLSGYIEDPDTSDKHGAESNLYFKKEYDAFFYFISFHYGERDFQIGYGYPTSQHPEEVFKQANAGLKETYVYKSEKELVAQLKRALHMILEKGIPFLESQRYEVFDINEALKESADLYYKENGFIRKQVDLNHWASVGAEFSYTKQQLQIIYKIEANRCMLNIDLDHNGVSTSLSGVLGEMLEKGALSDYFKSFRDMKLKCYFLSFHNKRQFVARLEDTFRYIEIAQNYLERQDQHSG